MKSDLKDVFSEFLSKLHALGRWADREKMKMYEPILGESLCDEVVEKVQGVIEVLEKIKERIRFYESEIAHDLDLIEESLRRLTETEEYRFLISERGMERLKELREKFGEFRSFYFPYTMREKRVEVRADG